MAQKILIVDDDPTQRRLLEAVIKRQSLPVLQAAGGQEAVDLLTGPQGADISVVFLDLVMPDMDGLAVMKAIRPVRPNVPVIVLTAKGSIDAVVTAMQAGATDFVVKPVSPERIQVSIQNALKLGALTGEISRLTRRTKNTMTFDDLIAESGAMRGVLDIAGRAAQSNIPVLIEGESGVGKELVARAIQGASDRSGKPFVTVNCGAIPDNLVESILFGHEKGAFTGASDKHTGKFQEANGGTLFLDEIGELRADIQVKLLRALQEGEVDPVGAKRPVKIDIRLISATNKDLLALTKTGEFREDLYYRLNVFPLEIPPLRARQGDIAPLVRHFIQRFAVEENKRIVGIEETALRLLQAYPWPGNVRQLENTVFRAVVLCDTERLSVHDFPQIAALLERDGYGAEDSGTPQPQVKSERDDLLQRLQETLNQPVTEEESSVGQAVQHGHANSSHTDGPSHTDVAGVVSILDGQGHVRSLEAVEGDLIRLALERYDGHMSEVARRLGIGRSTLYRKVRDLGLDTQKAVNE